MSRKCGSVDMPNHYLAETRRPATQQTGYITAEELAWDMSNYWRTSAEWLAWIRRKDGGPRYWGKGQKWHYPVRPEISAHCRPLSNLKRRVLP